MAEDGLDRRQMEALLRMAGGRLGMDADALAAQLAQGDVSGLGARLDPAKRQQFEALLQRPELAEQLLRSPAAAALLRQLRGG